MSQPASDFLHHLLLQYEQFANIGMNMYRPVSNTKSHVFPTWDSFGGKTTPSQARHKCDTTSMLDWEKERQVRKCITVDRVSTFDACPICNFVKDSTRICPSA
jgi:hypothetical protein